MEKRLKALGWSPLTALVVPVALILAVDASSTGQAVASPPPDHLLPAGTLQAANPVNRLDGLTVNESTDGSTVLTIQGSAKPTFNVYRLSDPDRVVIDVSGGERGKAVPRVQVDSWAVGRVTVDSAEENGAKQGRVMVSLKRDASYIVVPKGNDLVVTITPREVPPEAYFAHKSAGDRKAAMEALEKQAEENASEAMARAAAAERRAAAAERRVKTAAEELETARLGKKRLGRRDRKQIEDQKKELADLQAAAEKARKEAASAKADAEKEAEALRSAAREEYDKAKKAKDAGERDAAAVRAEAKKMLGDAEKELSTAKEEKARAAKARKEAETALAQARAEAKKAGLSKKKRDEVERALEQAEQAEKAAKARQKAAEDRITKLAKSRDTLLSQLERQAKESEALEKKIESRRAELARLEEDVAKAREKVDALGGAVTAKDLEEARTAASKAQARATVLSKDVARLEKEAAEARAGAKAAQEALAEAKATGRKKAIETAQATAKAEKEAADKLEASLARRKKALEEVGTNLREKEAELVALEERKAKLAKQGDDLKSKNAKARDELSASEKELTAVKKDLEKEKARLAALHGEVEKAQEQLDTTLSDARKRKGVAEEWKNETKAAGAAHIKDVRFEDGPNESRVIVDVNGPMIYAGSSLTPSMKLLEFEGAAIPEALERSLDASGYKGPVGLITSFKEGDKVKIIVSTRENSSPVLEEKPGQLIWKFPRTKGKGQGKAVSMAGSQVAGFRTPPVNAANETDSYYGQRNKWRGERIDIELQDAPIKDVLLLFSDIGRVNIIAGQGVSGTVTMRLTAVPWDQALDIILRSLGLGMVQQGNVIRVATTQALEEERRQAIERATAQVQLKPLETRLVPLSYATVGEMIPKVQSVLSSRGSVTPDTRTNTLIIMDVAENIALAEQLIDQLDSQTPQVLIEARIVEARTSWTRQLGIQWGFDWIASPGTGNPTGLLFPNSVGVAGGAAANNADTRGLILPSAAANPNYAVDLPAPVGTGAGGALGFSFGSISGNLNTNLRLSAAQDDGEVRIISAPKIVTLDNTEAQIEQGVQIPISQVSAQGVNTRYVNATLALRVTPHVTNEGSVLMDVQVQKNEADFINTGARGDPTILTNQAQSQLLVTDGDTAVIGGIFTRNQSVNFKKVPWFAEIPIIGWFFKNKAQADTRTELLIFLTPKIVNRSASIGG